MQLGYIILSISIFQFFFSFFRGTLNFDEFQKGMTKVAEKKYEDEGIKGDKALSKLEQQIISDGDVDSWMD